MYRTIQLIGKYLNSTRRPTYRYLGELGTLGWYFNPSIIPRLQGETPGIITLGNYSLMMYLYHVLSSSSKERT